jgi:hypothetical protein
MTVVQNWTVLWSVTRTLFFSRAFSYTMTYVYFRFQESYLLKRIVRTSLGNLRLLVLWWVCDDPLLNIVGATCPFLEALDVWRSSAVTDLGVKMLLSSDEVGGSSRSVKERCL